MISRFLLLVPSFTTKKVLKTFTGFFSNTQIFHPMFSMLYTGNLGLHYCVGIRRSGHNFGSTYIPMIAGLWIHDNGIFWFSKMNMLSTCTGCTWLHDTLYFHNFCSTLIEHTFFSEHFQFNSYKMFKHFQ